MRPAESPLRVYLKEIAWALLVLNVAAAGYAFLIGRAAEAGLEATAGVFLLGSALVTAPIVGLVCLNFVYVGVCDLIVRMRRR